MTKLILPLSVELGVKKKKKWILNLNNYRNTHFQVLNQVKIKYLEEVRKAITGDYTIYNCPVELIYTYYHGSNRRVDVANPCSILDKFCSDSLVILGLLPDDASQFVRSVSYLWGGVDSDNPRCELEIKALEDGKSIIQGVSNVREVAREAVERIQCWAYEGGITHKKSFVKLIKFLDSLYPKSND